MEWNRIESKWNEMARRLQYSAPAARTANAKINDAVTQPVAKPALKSTAGAGEVNNARAIF
ncbi:MAG: hypothetical protein JWS11_1614 [Cypionkella sp.]|nr:hypothetical protein [Cypionkella sp.]